MFNTEFAFVVGLLKGSSPSELNTCPVLEAARHASSIIRELYASSSSRSSRAESPEPDSAPLLPWEDQPTACQEYAN